MAHLDDPIEAATLAGIDATNSTLRACSPQSGGMSPHRYVVHLRLKRATELMRGRRSGLAEIAAFTGFADQSPRRVGSGAFTASPPLRIFTTARPPSPKEPALQARKMAPSTVAQEKQHYGAGIMCSLRPSQGLPMGRTRRKNVIGIAGAPKDSMERRTPGAVLRGLSDAASPT
jgi:hypothetical protein